MTDDNNSAPKVNIDDVMAKYEARRSRASALRAANKAVLFDALAEAGIDRVIVSFDGYGDSGQIENVELHGAVATLPNRAIVLAFASWEREEPDRRELSLAAAIEELAYDCLGDQHAGWEINEGSYGEFTFDVAARTILLDFNYRIESTENHQHDF